SLVFSPGPEARSNRSTRTDPLHQIVDLLLPQLVSYAVRHQPRRALADHFANLELVLAQRPAGRRQVHDAICQSCNRGKLDRSLDLDHLCLPPALLEITRGDAGILGRDPDGAETPLELVRKAIAGLRGDDHPAIAV